MNLILKNISRAFLAITICGLLITTLTLLTNFNVHSQVVSNKSQNTKRITLRQSLNQQNDEIRNRKNKKYTKFDEKIRSNIETYLIGKTRLDKTTYNQVVPIPGTTTEQIFEFDENNTKKSDTSLTTVVYKNRLNTNSDGQTSYEHLRYDLNWNIKTNNPISIDEYDISGQIIDKNQKMERQQSSEEDKAQEQSFYNKYGGNKKQNQLDEPIGIINKYESLETQKAKLKEKQEIFLNSEAPQAPRDNVDANSFNPFSINVEAGTSWNRDVASNYARQNAYNNYPYGYSNYYVSQPYQGDCANFVSQALFAGGLNKDYNNYDTNLKDWYFHWDNNQVGNLNARRQSNTWINAGRSADHMYQREDTSPWYRIYPNNAAYTLDIGDIVYINRGNGETFHVMMITGAQWRSDLGYWDALYTQHTTNKAYANFQLAYANNPNEKFYGLKIYNPVW